MEFRTRGANALGELGLDIHVDVLERGLELEFTSFDVSEDFLQPAFDLGKLGICKQSGAFLSPCMGDRPGDVVRE